MGIVKQILDGKHCNRVNMDKVAIAKQEGADYIVLQFDKSNVTKQKKDISVITIYLYGINIYLDQRTNGVQGSVILIFIGTLLKLEARTASSVFIKQGVFTGNKEKLKERT